MSTQTSYRTVFETKEWSAFLRKQFNYMYYPIEIETKSGKKIHIPSYITGKRFLFMKILYSTPPYYYGGINCDQSISIEELIDTFKTIASRIGIHSLTVSAHPCNPCSQFSGGEIDRFIYSKSSTHLLEIQSSFSVVWDKIFRSEKRNHVRKAIRSGVKISIDNSDYAVEQYYLLYLDSAQRWGLKDMEKKDFFFQERDYLAPHYRLLLAKVSGKIIAGVIVLSFDNKVYSFHQASLSNYWDLSANNLLLSTSIEIACNERKQYYDFLPSGRIQSVEKFKESFGAVKYSFNIYRINNNFYNKAVNMKNKLSERPPRLSITPPNLSH